MPPEQGSALGARIGIRVPSNLNTAVEQLANERNYQAGPHDEVKKSDIVREAIAEYLRNLALEGELPEETMDLLDEDLKSNAGAGGIPDDLGAEGEA